MEDTRIASSHRVKLARLYRRRIRAAAVFASLLVALTFFLSAASASVATTGPSHQRYVYLIVTDHQITFHNDNLTQLTRGSYLRFFVFNEGKRKHQLEVRGVRTPVIKPGGRGQTRWILFNSRGTFRFFDPTDRALSGIVQIL
jgi:hypothetical protein